MPIYFIPVKKFQTNKNSYDIDWLLNGNVDKPTYFVSKINSVDAIAKDYPQLKELYRKNGFVFYSR